ncbi:hypothetical protein AMELA_G00043670 [Ameiurus melas]|uniref:Uncharacterized protein n=1 Tax=Ameiurus melas TaxID=219545 RepID=A0A7J6B4R3_AMEME|nr:hypothetical protein AMELA_G00043670 [Ameiurus melas]
MIWADRVNGGGLSGVSFLFPGSYSRFYTGELFQRYLKLQASEEIRHTYVNRSGVEKGLPMETRFAY